MSSYVTLNPQSKPPFDVIDSSGAVDHDWSVLSVHYNLMGHGSGGAAQVYYTVPSGTAKIIEHATGVIKDVPLK